MILVLSVSVAAMKLLIKPDESTVEQVESELRGILEHLKGWLGKHDEHQLEDRSRTSIFSNIYLWFGRVLGLNMEFSAFFCILVARVVGYRVRARNARIRAMRRTTKTPLLFQLHNNTT